MAYLTKAKEFYEEVMAVPVGSTFPESVKALDAFYTKTATSVGGMAGA